MSENLEVQLELKDIYYLWYKYLGLPSDPGTELLITWADREIARLNEPPISLIEVSFCKDPGHALKTLQNNLTSPMDSSITYANYSISHLGERFEIFDEIVEITKIISCPKSILEIASPCCAPEKVRGYHLFYEVTYDIPQCKWGAIKILSDCTLRELSSLVEYLETVRLRCHYEAWPDVPVDCPSALKKIARHYNDPILFKEIILSVIEYEMGNKHYGSTYEPHINTQFNCLMESLTILQGAQTFSKKQAEIIECIEEDLADFLSHLQVA